LAASGTSYTASSTRFSLALFAEANERERERGEFVAMRP
jgi:hypothetical protein